MTESSASILLRRILQLETVVDLNEVRTVIRKRGIPVDEYSVRMALWSILLSVYPPQPSGWREARIEMELNYRKFCDEFIVKPELSFINDEADHPLSTNLDSSWKKYFEDKEMREQIDRDIQRTQTQLNFFGGEYKGMKHREKMSRALFIYYKLNPGIRYVQGMNEIFAVIYFVFAAEQENDTVIDIKGDPEVFAFYGFLDLMGEFRDNYCDKLDKSVVGIAGNMGNITRLIKQINPELALHLERLEISPYLYAIRWITALFTQEFVLPDVIIIWDRMLSEKSKIDFVVRVSASMVLLEATKLLQSDFSGAMKLLQQYPSTDILRIIQYSDNLK